MGASDGVRGALSASAPDHAGQFAVAGGACVGASLLLLLLPGVPFRVVGYLLAAVAAVVCLVMTRSSLQRRQAATGHVVSRSQLRLISVGVVLAVAVALLQVWFLLDELRL